jgi:hypothetical protein
MKVFANLALALVVFAGGVQASDRVAAYVLVEKVVMDKPGQIQIWGVFSVAEPNNPASYQALRRGLYVLQAAGRETGYGAQ